MKATSTAKITVHLSLTEEEARWLKAIMQNPFVCDKCQQELSDYKISETNDNRILREELFDALKEHL